MKEVSIVFPAYIPSLQHKQMTDKALYLAKKKTFVEAEWVIVETGSNYYSDEADLYLYERERTTPNASINRGFNLASGNFVVFLANDVFVDDYWIECLLDCFRLREDCGLASLGTKEFNQEKKDELLEKIYFSVAMVRKEDAWFDKNYEDLFDDSDLLMRVLTRGQKCYQNLNCIVEHQPHSTYGKPDLNSEKNIAQREYFKNKWRDYINHPAYKLFV